MTTPLALFTFNRPAHTRRALAALASCSRLDDVTILLYSDAPKRPEQAAAVAATRDVLRDFAASHPARVVERSRNLGLAGSIAGSVSSLTAEHGRVIVLEDDLVVTPDFLIYMLDGLDRYEHDERVMQISGCLITDAVESSSDVLFMPVTTTWGWATWARAWTHFRPETVDPSLLDRDLAFRGRFTVDGAGEAYVSMLRDRLAGANDSWGILWWWAVARAAGQVAYPRRSLVWNGGFDNSGVHCGGTEEFHPDPPEIFRAPRLGSPMSFPERVQTHAGAYADLSAHLTPPSQTLHARLGRGFRRMIGILGTPRS